MAKKIDIYEIHPAAMFTFMFAILITFCGLFLLADHFFPFTPTSDTSIGSIQDDKNEIIGHDPIVLPARPVVIP